MNKGKKFLVLFATIISGLFFGGMLGRTSPKTEGIQPMKPLQVKNQPELGLSIIDESDPSFNDRLSAWVKNPSPASLDALKRFSVFVVNNSPRPIVALVVNWEFMQPDGQTVSKYKAVRQQGLFHDGHAYDRLKNALGQSFATEARPIIDSQSSRLVSLLDATSIKPQETQLIKDRTDVPNEARQKAEMYTRGQLDELNRMIQRSISWSVSIDGVFFKDGTFTGPDKMGFFDIIQAEIKARVDLFTTISNLITQSKDAQSGSYETVFNYVQSLASNGKLKQSEFDATSFYTHKQSILARELLNYRKAMGDEKAIGFVKEQLNAPRIQLTKR